MPARVSLNVPRRQASCIASGIKSGPLTDRRVWRLSGCLPSRYWVRWFANWLRNDQGIGDTESGACTLPGATAPALSRRSNNGLSVLGTSSPGCRLGEFFFSRLLSLLLVTLAPLVELPLDSLLPERIVWDNFGLLPFSPSKTGAVRKSRLPNCFKQIEPFHSRIIDLRLSSAASYWAWVPDLEACSRSRTP
jgi:hypothetical protein